MEKDVFVVFSLVSIEIVLSSKTLQAYSTVKGIMVFVSRYGFSHQITFHADEPTDQ
jgi:hypothetical protein